MMLNGRNNLATVDKLRRKRMMMTVQDGDDDDDARCWRRWRSTMVTDADVWWRSTRMNVDGGWWWWWLLMMITA